MGRLLNFLLVPLYTAIFAPEEYGVLSELMVVAAFAMVVLTYGVETAYFHFTNKDKNPENVLSTGFISLLTSSILFLFIALHCSRSIAKLLHVPEHPSLINWLIWVLFLDVLTTLPFANLRVNDKAWRFAFIRLTNIIVNIGLNLFFYLLCPYLIKQGVALKLIGYIYDPGLGIGYIFISNLIASSVMLLLLTPEILKLNFAFDFKIWKKMITYGFPLLIGGLAYVTNEMVDRLLLEYLLPADTATAQVGIYSACYKIAIFMSLFVQGFSVRCRTFFLCTS